MEAKKNNQDLSQVIASAKNLTGASTKEARSKMIENSR